MQVLKSSPMDPLFNNLEVQVNLFFWIDSFHFMGQSSKIWGPNLGSWY